jgi:amino-acid N-acetyltransferase
MDKSVVQLTPEKDYKIRCARIDDLATIKKLLSSNGLPTVGIDEYVDQFLVADQQEVIGTIGVLFEGEKALLRSFVVNTEQRGSGIGSALVKDLLKEIKNRGIEEAYLLTETAEEYFKRMGFYNISRDDMPHSLLKESGLDQACPCSSRCMKFTL